MMRSCYVSLAPIQIPGIAAFMVREGPAPISPTRGTFILTHEGALAYARYKAGPMGEVIDETLDDPGAQEAQR